MAPGCPLVRKEVNGWVLCRMGCDVSYRGELIWKAHEGGVCGEGRVCGCVLGVRVGGPPCQ